jgi:hypothetical protein
MVDAVVSLQRAQAPGFRVVSRRSVQLADGLPAIELVTEMGVGTVGHSRRLFMMVADTAYIIDAESFRESWSMLEPVFNRIIDSFRVRR